MPEYIMSYDGIAQIKGLLKQAKDNATRWYGECAELDGVDDLSDQTIAAGILVASLETALRTLEDLRKTL